MPESALLAQRHAHANGLIYVSDAEPGIARLRRGKAFHYLRPDHRRITSERTLDRIRRLAIPPAYTDVWICRHDRGHIQATGRDARRRKQYRYHAAWRRTRDGDKFSRMIEFGARLPQLRRRLKRDLALPGLPKNKVLAVVVTLLDDTLIRVGNEEYARSNKSYGLTTLRDHHVKFLRDGRASFCFRGKSGKQQEIVLDDRRLGKLIRRCRQIPGQHLFQFMDDDGKRQSIDSGMVNDYLRDVMGTNREEGFTAKDFRTWGATVCAIVFLSCQEVEESMSERTFNRCVAATAKKVSEALGNTPAVCRKSYINPVVFAAWRARSVAQHVPHSAVPPRKLEKLVLALLRDQPSTTPSVKSARKTRSQRPALAVV